MGRMHPSHRGQSRAERQRHNQLGQVNLTGEHCLGVGDEQDGPAPDLPDFKFGAGLPLAALAEMSAPSIADFQMSIFLIDDGENARP